MRSTLTNFLIFLFTLGCLPSDEQPKERPSETSLLEDYLLANFNKPLMEKRHYYVIVPRFGCYGCMQRVLIQLSKELDSTNVQDFSYIISNRNEQVLSAIDPKVEKLHDSTGKIDQINLRLYGLKIITTEGKKITNNRSFHPDSLKQLSDFLD